MFCWPEIEPRASGIKEAKKQKKQSLKPLFFVISLWDLLLATEFVGGKEGSIYINLLFCLRFTS